MLFLPYLHFTYHKMVEGQPLAIVIIGVIIGM